MHHSNQAPEPTVTGAGCTVPHTDAAARILHERLRELQPLIRDRAEKGEANGRIDQEVIDALTAAGAFKLAVPRRYGGHEFPLRTFLEMNNLIGRADTSTAWVSTLLNVCSWVVGRLSDRAQQDIWGENPDAKVCGVLAPTGTSRKTDGGYIISGKWGFASGSQHADWSLLGIPLVDETGTQVDQAVAVARLDELEYVETWKVAGMKGTGSNTLVADDIFVPEHRIMSVSAALRGETSTEYTHEGLYQAAFAPVMALVLAGPITGAAQGAFELVRASLAKGKGISYTFYDHAVDSPSTQMAMAHAATAIDSALLHMYRSADCLDGHSAAGTSATLLERARVRMDTGHAATKTREAMDTLMSVQGAGGFATANPLQRLWRDLNTASRHAVIGPEISTEIYGRLLLDVEEPVSPMV